jgi:hypothetical protein
VIVRKWLRAPWCSSSSGVAAAGRKFLTYMNVWVGGFAGSPMDWGWGG